MKKLKGKVAIVSGANQGIGLVLKNGIASVLSILLVLFTLSSCSEDDESETSQTYVLVHGAWQASYVWDAVRDDLVNKGNKVIVVELPGHGADQALPHTLTLDVYRDKVIDALNKVDGKVILVGHSMAGMVITHVAEKVPSRIDKLVYIGAFLPASGQSLVDLAFSDPGSKLKASLISSADQLTIDVQRDNLTYLFINDGSQTDKERVVANYRAEPAIPLTNTVTLTEDNFGAVEKVYIKTLQDVVISPDFQDHMIAEAGIKTVYEVNTSHSPFLAQPHVVSDLLLKVGE